MRNEMKVFSSRAPNSWWLRNAFAMSGRASWVGWLRDTHCASRCAMVRGRESGIGRRHPPIEEVRQPDDPVVPSAELLQLISASSDQTAGLLPQPPKDTAFGDQHGVCGDAQLGRGLRGR